VEVIADDESEIMEAIRRMSDGYDFVVTRQVSGATPNPYFYYREPK
jgi:molybdopterin-biosynthesis enzyme MoeA-like protein